MSYAARLDGLWAAATAPRAAGAPTMVSAFAGFGGSVLGYLAAGFRDVLAIDHEPHAAACLRLNFGGAVWDQDIAALDPAQIGARPGWLDLLDGSPPCQGFSTLGFHDPADPRNGLFAHFVRLARAWQPRAVVMENVPGMISKPEFREVIDALAGAGYRTRAAALPAAYFGAATIRRRLIIVGVRADLGIAPSHPPPAARPATVREAWRDLPEPGPAGPPPPPAVPGKQRSIAPYIAPGKGADNVLTARGRRRSYFSLRRVAWDRPAPALSSLFRFSDYLHPAENRYLTVPEMMRIQGIPDAYAWPPGTSYKKAHARIGNSVCPLVTRALGEHIRSAVLGQAA